MSDRDFLHVPAGPAEPPPSAVLRPTRGDWDEHVAVSSDDEIFQQVVSDEELDFAEGSRWGAGAVLRPDRGAWDERGDFGEELGLPVVGAAVRRSGFEPALTAPAVQAVRGRKRRLRSKVLAVVLAGLLMGAGYVTALVASTDSTDTGPASGLRRVELSDAAGETQGDESGQLNNGNQASALASDQYELGGSAEGGADGIGGLDESALGSDGVAQARLELQATDPADITSEGSPSSENQQNKDPVVDVAAVLSPSVVRIEVGTDMAEWTGMRMGVGSGIVWDADNGYIVTNQHVVDGFDEVKVSLADGTHLVGRVIGGSSAHDVAVVQVETDEVELVAATFAPVSSVRIGQLAVAIGSPFGLTGTVTAGIVSAVRIQVSGGIGSTSQVPMEMIQTDAAINQGNSGGALADSEGRVIGMNTLIQTTTGGSMGLGFAVPSDTVELIATRVINGEPLELGYLGISGSVDSEDIQGVLIAEVVEGTPAHDAGLRAGDVILSMDGRKVNNMAELSAAVKLRIPGEKVELTLRRGDDTYAATVTLGTWE